MVKRLVGSLLGASAAWVALVGAQPVRMDAYRSIVALEAQRSLGPGTLATLVNGKNRTLAVRAALAIGRTRDPHGAPLLVAHLHDGNVELRAMSVYGLGLIASGTAAREIVGALRDRAGAVRVAAIDAVGRYETASRLPADLEASAAASLADRMKNDADPIVRARAATAFEAFRNSPMGDFASRELPAAFAKERNPDVRWHIMWTLFRGYAVRVPRAFFTAALHDPEELVRIEAVRAYGRLKNADAIPALQPLTKDSSWRVQLQALESIRALKGQAPTDHLAAMPRGIHTPPFPRIKIMEIRALPRVPVAGKPGRPVPENAIALPRLHPNSSAFMSGPMPGPHPRVRIGTTKGTMIVTLYPEWAPLTVENFLNLTNRGYYDGLRWFRIVPDFVVQTGDPSDNGEGDAGYTIPAEENPLEQRSYVISMGLNYKGNAPIRDSAGTQFYITLSPQLHLNRDFTVFGEVTSGTDVLGRLVETDRMTRVEQLPQAP